jgi:hypothetical protein
MTPVVDGANKFGARFEIAQFSSRVRSKCPSEFDQVIVRTAVFDALPKVALIVTVVLLLTVVVSTSKSAEVLPAGIVTVVGTVAEGWLLEIETTSPPTGAIEVIVTVPVLDLPPATVDGLNVTDLRVGAAIVRVVD